MSIQAPTAIFNEVTSLKNEVTRSYDQLRLMISEIDRELSVVYHEIESSKFDVVRGYKFAKKLQAVLQRRRVLKGEFALIQPIYHMFLNNFDKTRDAYEKAGNKYEELRTRLNTSITTEDVIG
jgi:hypothetical protein